jgi:phenylpropionate dioxygenase-like ring-hydroxylating dioxygenase large terminal subunit
MRFTLPQPPIESPRAMMDFKKLEDYWYVLCESSDVKRKPRSFKLLDREIVVYRTSKGEVAAFIDKCPHRNVKMSEGHVADDKLVCQFHGWEFNAEGRCVHVPGMVERDDLRAPNLKKYDTVEEHGLVFICLAANSPRRPHIPAHMTDPAYRYATHRTHLKCGMHNIAENFLDPFHTPFVHAGIIRTASKRSLNKINPMHLEDGLEVEYLKEVQQSGFIGMFGRTVHRDVGRFLMPGIIELEYHSQEGIEFVNTMYITPRSHTESSIYFKASLRPYRLPVWLVYAIAGMAIKYALYQDRVILEKQTQIAMEQGEAYANTELDIVKRQLDNLYAGNGRRIEFKPLEAMI